jgi:hypothetical protein
MFCEQCGSSLAPGAQYCARCGRRLVGQVQLAYPSRHRVQEHIRLLGIFWMALSAVNLIGGGVLLILANTLFPRWSHFAPNVHPTFLQPLLSFIGILILAKAAAGFLAGYGPLQCAFRNRTGNLHFVGFVAIHIGRRVQRSLESGLVRRVFIAGTCARL